MSSSSFEVRKINNHWQVFENGRPYPEKYRLKQQALAGMTIAHGKLMDNIQNLAKEEVLEVVDSLASNNVHETIVANKAAEKEQKPRKKPGRPKGSKNKKPAKRAVKRKRVAKKNG